jgi:hypothetical protein
MRRWLSLTRKERQLVIAAAVYVGTAAIGVRVFGLRRLLKWADRPITADRTDANGPKDAKNPVGLAVAVERAGRYVPGGTCLARSLALTRMLRKRGLPAETRIGVKTADGFRAHAWVEVEGVPVTSEIENWGIENSPIFKSSGGPLSP